MALDDPSSSASVGAQALSTDVQDIHLACQQPGSAAAREALGRLMKRHRNMVFFWVLQVVHNTAFADDLTQEVLLHMMQKLHTVREPASFPGWLRVVARRMALNALQRDQRRPGLSLERDVADLRSADSSLRHDEREALLAAVDSLRPLDREVLQHYYLNQQSIAAIANELGIPSGTVKRRLHTARKRLFEILEQHPFMRDAV